MPELPSNSVAESVLDPLFDRTEPPPPAPGKGPSAQEAGVSYWELQAGRECAEFQQAEAPRGAADWNLDGD